MLDQLRGVCQGVHDSCTQERAELAGEIIEVIIDEETADEINMIKVMKNCYDAEQSSGALQSNPLVYRVI